MVSLLVAVSGEEGKSCTVDGSVVGRGVFGVMVSLSLLAVFGVDDAAYTLDVLVAARGVLGATVRSSLITVSCISGGELILVSFLDVVEDLWRVENARSLASRVGDVCFAFSS